MTILYRPQAADLGNSSPVLAPTLSLIDAAHEARTVLNRTLGDIAKLRSNLVAVRLAAHQDEMTKGSTLYWPDLLAALESLLPDEAPLDRAVEQLMRAIRLESKPG